MTKNSRKFLKNVETYYNKHKDKMLQESPVAVDGGNLIGRDPREMPVEELKELGHPTSLIKAIREKCLDCVESVSEVRKCVQFNCPLWPFRMGRNPHWGKRQ